MANTWTEEEIAKALNDVIRSAEKDPGVRALALKDPRAAVERVTGKALPAGAKLSFVEQGKDAIVLAGGEATLSDDQLARVAGGVAGGEAVPAWKPRPG
jgi:hypothetical protein